MAKNPIKYDPAIHHRRSIRLKGHDYAGGGEYFVTICAHREVGKIFDPPEVREMIRRVWDGLPNRFPEITEGASMGGRASMGGGATVKDARTAAAGAGFMPAASPASAPMPAENFPIVIMPDHFHALIALRGGEHSLGEIVGAFKSLVVHEYIAGVKRGEWPRFSGKIWHRNYYERIIRSAEDRERTAHYIRFNPVKLQFRIEGMAAMGNPALWSFPTLGILASGHGTAGNSPTVCSGTALWSGCHSGLEEQLVRESRRPLIWMPAVRPDSVGFSDWQLKRLEAGTLLVVCPFEETHTTRENALKRNRLIAERCDQLWIPAVRDGGSLEKLKNEYQHKMV